MTSLCTGFIFTILYLYLFVITAFSNLFSFICFDFSVAEDFHFPLFLLKGSICFCCFLVHWSASLFYKLIRVSISLGLATSHCCTFRSCNVVYLLLFLWVLLIQSCCDICMLYKNVPTRVCNWCDVGIVGLGHVPLDRAVICESIAGGGPLAEQNHKRTDVTADYLYRFHEATACWSCSRRILCSGWRRIWERLRTPKGR